MSDGCAPARFLELEYSPDVIVDRVLTPDRRVLILGQPGSGKSTLASALAATLCEAHRGCSCISADPGSPAFGVPGAVCAGRWERDHWQTTAVEALCSLDAARFRLPLVAAVARLARSAPAGPLLIDAPGVVRGAAGAELLTGLLESVRIDAIVVLQRAGREPPLPDELDAAGVAVFVVPAAPAARWSTKRARARERTRLWNAYLEDAGASTFDLGALRLLGMPPPRDAPAAWAGRQIALLRGNRMLALGEVLALEGTQLTVRIFPVDGEPTALLVRDAQRLDGGHLGTARHFAASSVRFVPPDVLPVVMLHDAGGPRPVARVGPVVATLVNGVFGDPLLHLRLRHQKRSLLFDLGEAARLPARIAHQVSDVFISHAHVDHIAGFLWLLRARIGELGVCRVFGPPGLALNVRGLVDGVHWDRVGNRGPSFEVNELHGERLHCFAIQAGRAETQRLGERAAPRGVVLREHAFCVRAETLDHGTPVLAYAFEPAQQLNVRKERLAERGWPAGPWLTELKRRIAAHELEALVRLPDGAVRQAGTLAGELLLVTPGEKLAYATDLADTPENRVRLAELAHDAHTFFCEASFAECHAAQAGRTGHLTARACGEIATAARVERLVPFHFSKRYEDDPAPVYAEVRAACSRTVLPPT